MYLDHQSVCSACRRGQRTKDAEGNKFVFIRESWTFHRCGRSDFRYSLHDEIHKRRQDQARQTEDDSEKNDGRPAPDPAGPGRAPRPLVIAAFEPVGGEHGVDQGHDADHIAQDDGDAGERKSAVDLRRRGRRLRGPVRRRFTGRILRRYCLLSAMRTEKSLGRERFAAADAIRMETSETGKTRFGNGVRLINGI